MFDIIMSLVLLNKYINKNITIDIVATVSHMSIKRVISGKDLLQVLMTLQHSPRSSDGTNT